MPQFRETSRRDFLAQAGAAATFIGVSTAASAGSNDYSASEIAIRDALNLDASRRSRSRAVSRYQPLTGGIVHFFGYGQSMSGGWYGVPVVSATQPYDSLMIGDETRASSQAAIDTTWVPVGTPNSDGLYPFNPMIATPESPAPITAGETPAEGAINYLRRAYLRQMGVATDPACRFVLTNCSAGGHTIAQLAKGATPEIFNRLRDAANQVKATAASLGLSYQVGGMIWTQGEADVSQQTSYR